jgi:hypothetical protein
MNNRGTEPWVQRGRRADMFDLKPGKQNVNILPGLQQLSAMGGWSLTTWAFEIATYI